MYYRRTLKYAPSLTLAAVVVGVGFVAYAQHQTSATQVKAAAEEANATPAVRQSADDAAQTAKPTVTVDGKPIDVPSNGSVSTDVSGGGHVEVSSSQSNGSTSTTTTGPNGSVSVSISSVNGNSTASTNTQVFSNSQNQSSNWSQLNVFSTGTSNVQAHH